MVGVGERGAPELLAELDQLIGLRGSELVLAHVIDNGARGEIDRARGRLLPRPLPAHRVRAIGEAERQAAQATLGEAAAAARSLGATAEVLEAEGEPGRVLSRLAEERDCHLVVVAARVEGDGTRTRVPTPSATPPGSSSTTAHGRCCCCAGHDGSHGGPSACQTMIPTSPAAATPTEVR